MSAGSDTSPLPRRLSYAIGGGAIAIASWLGLLWARNLQTGATRSVRLLLEDLAPGSTLYGQIALLVTIALVAIGYLIGREEDRLWTQATVDPVTALPNRSGYERRLADELGRARRDRAPLALLVIDVDHLKELNDAGGHQAGDRALRLVADGLRGTCRSHDLAARWGGDEFVVLAPATTARDAQAIAERLRAMLKRLSLPLAQSVSVSIGIADLEAVEVERPDALFQAADRALYVAKTGGRDRAITAPPVGRASPFPALGGGGRAYASSHPTNPCTG